MRRFSPGANTTAAPISSTSKSATQFVVVKTPSSLRCALQRLCKRSPKLRGNSGQKPRKTVSAQPSALLCPTLETQDSISPSSTTRLLKQKPHKPSSHIRRSMWFRSRDSSVDLASRRTTRIAANTQTSRTPDEVYCRVRCTRIRHEAWRGAGRYTHNYLESIVDDVNI